MLTGEQTPGMVEGRETKSCANSEASVMSATDNLDGFVMVNVRSRSSGLPMNAWIGPRDGARHNARIKVQMDHRETFDYTNLASVSVEDTPPEIKEGTLSARDLDLVRQYIAQNKRAIMDHWYEKTDGIELSKALRPLKP